MARSCARAAAAALLLAAAGTPGAHAASAMQHGGSHASQLSMHLGGAGADTPRHATHSIPCRWTDPKSGSSWDLRPLMMPGSSYVFHDAMADSEHDSVHAALRAAEESVKAPAAPKSGRLLDQGLGRGRRDAADDKETDDGIATRSVHAHDDNPDEYDFHVNVCTEVAHKPVICADKPAAPAYQLVVPKQPEPSDSDSFFADSDDGYGSSDGGGAHGRPIGPSHHLHRAAQPVAAPTECHALGSLSNVSFGLIKAGRPELGVALTYRSGDECMKRVVTRPASLTPGAVGSSLPVVSWVPSPRQLTLRFRCDPLDSGEAGDLAAAMQLARRVRVVETEMCEYVVEWPTRHACPTAPKHVALRAAASLATPRGAPALLLLLVLAAAAAQVARQWRTLRVLGHGLRAGDPRAWRQALAAMMSKDAPRASQRRYTRDGHEI